MIAAAALAATETVAQQAPETGSGFSVTDLIMGHILDSREIEIPFTHTGPTTCRSHAAS